MIFGRAFNGRFRPIADVAVANSAAARKRLYSPLQTSHRAKSEVTTPSLNGLPQWPHVARGGCPLGWLATCDRFLSACHFCLSASVNAIVVSPQQTVLARDYSMTGFHPVLPLTAKCPLTTHCGLSRHSGSSPGSRCFETLPLRPTSAHFGHSARHRRYSPISRRSRVVATGGLLRSA